MPPAGSHFSVAEKMMMSRIATQYDGMLIPVIANIDTRRSMTRPRITAASTPSVNPVPMPRVAAATASCTVFTNAVPSNSETSRLRYGE